MAPYDIDVTLDETLATAAINFTICCICMIVRIYQIEKYKTKLTSLVMFGALSIIAALLHCAAILWKVIMQNYGWDSYPTCRIIYISSRVLYALHRAFFYAFVVWRVDIVNESNRISGSTICVAKCIVVSCGMFLVGGMLFFVKTSERCNMEVNADVMLTGWALDIIILAASWIFLRPLLGSLKTLQNFPTQKIVEKEAFCIMLSILSTVATAVCNYLWDGIMEISIGIDCSITTCCLVALAKPVAVTETKHWFFCCHGCPGTQMEKLSVSVNQLTPNRFSSRSSVWIERDTIGSDMKWRRETNSMRLTKELEDVLASLEASSQDEWEPVPSVVIGRHDTKERGEVSRLAGTEGVFNLAPNPSNILEQASTSVSLKEITVVED